MIYSLLNFFKIRKYSTEVYTSYFYLRITNCSQRLTDKLTVGSGFIIYF